MLSFWFLNHDLEDDELRWQLDEMKDKRFTGVFIHPRDGLSVPYGTELWFHKVSVIIEHCARIGLQAWLYDEEPFPSGTAGGRVFFDRPEFKARHLTMESFDAGGGRVKLDFAPGRLIRTIGIRKENGRLTREWLDLSKHTGLIRSEWGPGYIQHGIYYPPYTDSGNPHWRAASHSPHYRIDCVLPDGDWTVCAFVEREMPSGRWGFYTDLMNPDAVRYFIELTHEKYAERYGDLFGGVIPGIFTDEFKVIGDAAWSPVLDAFFRNLFGYDIEERLPDLFLTVDESTAQVRHDYRLALSKLLKASYVEPIAEWCAKHRLLMTGHISPEEDPVGMTKWTPYLLSLLKGFHLPGTDLIGGKIGSEEYPLLHLGPKFASSAAHHSGKREAIVEAYGANGWETDYKTMLKMADWLFVMGITDVVVHGQYYSVDGLRKKEAPPSFFYQSSHWPFFGDFSDYIVRMSSLLKGGDHRCHLLVYYPQAAFSALIPDRLEEADALRRRLGDLLHELLSFQWDFDLVDEETLLGMEVQDGKLQGCGGETYDLLLLPYGGHIESGTARMCGEFMEQGFPVWLIGSEPQIVKSAGEIGSIDELAAAAVQEKPFWTKSVERESLLAELSSVISKDLTLWRAQAGGGGSEEPAQAYVHVRVSGSNSRVMFVNAVKKRQAVCLKHPVTGEVVEFVLPPNGGVLLDVKEDGFDWKTGAGRVLEAAAYPGLPDWSNAASLSPQSGGDAGFTIDISRDWSLKPKNDNVLVLSHWHFWDHERKQGQPVTLTPAVNLIAQPSVCFDKEGHGYCRFYAEGDPGPTFLVYEQSAWSGECVIAVNGQEIPFGRQTRRYDVHNFEVDISPYLKRGSGVQTNVVEAHFHAGGQLREPFRLYGAFKVSFPYAGFPPGQLHYGDSECHLHHLDSWDDVGYPHYAGTMAYEKEITLTEEWLDSEAESAWLYAEEVNDAARLYVNGICMGTCLSEPFAWDVTGSLQAGVNRISIEAVNSPIAMFEGGRKRAGLRGRIRLIKR